MWLGDSAAWFSESVSCVLEAQTQHVFCTRAAAVQQYNSSFWKQSENIPSTKVFKSGKLMYSVQHIRTINTGTYPRTWYGIMGDILTLIPGTR